MKLGMINYVGEATPHDNFGGGGLGTFLLV